MGRCQIREHIQERLVVGVDVVVRQAGIGGTFRPAENEQQLDRNDIVGQGAAERLEEVASTLRQDELNAAAADRLRALAEQAQAILNPPPPPGRVLLEGSLRRGGRSEVLARLRALADEVERATEGLTETEAEAITMTGQIRITAPGKAR